MLAAAGLSTHSHLKATLSHMPTPSRNAEAATNSMNSSGKGPLVVGAGVRNHPTSPLSLFLSHSHSMPQPESHSHSGPRSLSKGHPHTLAFDGPPHLHGSAGKHLHGILNGSLSNTGNTAAGMLVPGGRPPASPSPVLALLSGGLHTSNSLAGGLGGFSSPTAHRSTNAQDNAHASKENAWSPHGAMGLLPLVVPSTGKGGQPGTSTKAGGMPVSMRSPFHNGKIQGASSLPAHSNQAAGGATSHVASAGATNALIGLSSGGGMGVSSASGIHASGAGTPMGFGQRATGRVPSSPMVSGGLAAALTRFAC